MDVLGVENLVCKSLSTFKMHSWWKIIETFFTKLYMFPLCEGSQIQDLGLLTVSLKWPKAKKSCGIKGKHQWCLNWMKKACVVLSNIRTDGAQNAEFRKESVYSSWGCEKMRSILYSICGWQEFEALRQIPLLDQSTLSCLIRSSQKWFDKIVLDIFPLKMLLSWFYWHKQLHSFTWWTSMAIYGKGKAE